MALQSTTLFITYTINTFICFMIIGISLNCFGSQDANIVKSNRKSKISTFKVVRTVSSEGQKAILEHLSESWSTKRGVIWGFDFLPLSDKNAANLKKKSNKKGNTYNAKTFHTASKGHFPRLIVTERGGQMYILSLLDGDKKVISGLPKMVEIGQGGLMDVRVHPQFSQNKWIFFSYVARYEGGTGTIVAKAQLDDLKLKNIKILFRSSPPGSGGRHFGCRIVFKDNTIYFAIGDRGDRHKAQDLSYPNGKVYRIYEDGSIPKDNPFVGQKLKNGRMALDAIWSYGHRNPQGLAIHPHTGELWEQEHGPRGGDEINLIKKGKNYGWPVITYGREYWGPSIGTTHKSGMQQPVKFYVPSIAPSSLMIYSGRLFTAWKGNLFSTALRDPHIDRIVIKNKKRSKGLVPEVFKQESLLNDFPERIRHIREAPNGQIIFSTDSGNFYRLTIAPKK